MILQSGNLNSMTTSLNLKLSQAANILLATIALIGFLKPTSGPVATPSQTIRIPQELPVPMTKAFQWDQVESADFSIYINNLRAISCPELTIRRLIAVEVDDLYEEKRQKATELAAQSNGSANEPLGKTLQKLNQEEKQVVATLMHDGSPEDSNSPAAKQAATAARNGPESQPSLLAMPAVFHDINASLQAPTEPGAEPTTSFTAEELAAVKRLRNRFVEEIGGTNQNPKDPAYVKRWIEARHQIDEELQAQLGTDSYNAYMMKVGRTPDSPSR